MIVLSLQKSCSGLPQRRHNHVEDRHDQARCPSAAWNHHRDGDHWSCRYLDDDRTPPEGDGHGDRRSGGSHPPLRAASSEVVTHDTQVVQPGPATDEVAAGPGADALQEQAVRLRQVRPHRAGSFW